MVTRTNDLMAQAVYMAQLEACRSQCKCRTCQILRKASESMVSQFLQPPAPKYPTPEEIIIDPENQGVGE